MSPLRPYRAAACARRWPAERVALGYPDLFRGALLMAGSDPIGTAVTARLKHVRDLPGAGKVAAARTQLARIDARYGGIAAPRSLTLARELEHGNGHR